MYHPGTVLGTESESGESKERGNQGKYEEDDGELRAWSGRVMMLQWTMHYTTLLYYSVVVVPTLLYYKDMWNCHIAHPPG